MWIQLKTSDLVIIILVASRDLIFAERSHLAVPFDSPGSRSEARDGGDDRNAAREAARTFAAESSLGGQAGGGVLECRAALAAAKRSTRLTASCSQLKILPIF